jgi:hypothetical protein
MAIANAETNRNIAQLNSFLRGEISAVETYRIAIEKLDASSPALTELYACLKSHERRVEKLTAKIQALGGNPDHGSGAWGAMTKALEKGAAVFGDKVAIALLEEGEDHGLKDYRHDIEKLDAEARMLVTSELLPQQEETHRKLSTLKKMQRGVTA